MRAVLEQHRSELRHLDLDLATFMIVTSVEAVTHQATLGHPELISDPRLEDEIVELVLRYLGLAPEVRASAPRR